MKMTSDELMKAMLQLARIEARLKSNNETVWIPAGHLRLAYYPASRTHTWFGKEGPTDTKTAAMYLLSQSAKISEDA